MYLEGPRGAQVPSSPLVKVPLAGCQANKGFKVQSGGDFRLHSRVSLTRFSQVSALETVSHWFECILVRS